MGLYLLSGTPAADPQPPELTRTALVYEVSLARCGCVPGQTVIEPEDVEDERADESVCGMPCRSGYRLCWRKRWTRRAA